MNEIEEMLLEFNWVQDTTTIRTTYNKRYFITTPIKIDILYSIVFKSGRWYIYQCNEKRSQKFGKRIYLTSITTVEEYLNFFKNDVEEIRKYKLKICIGL